MKFNEEQVYGYPRTINSALRPAKRIVSAVEKRLYSVGALSAKKLTLPDFLGIGGPQSGSTWLHTQLKIHPEICMPANEKELHFFDRNFFKPLPSYSAQFSHKNAGQCCGEVTPGYSRLNTDQIAFIKKIMPDVKLIYIVRNPVEQRLSRTRRELGKRGVTSTDAIDLETLWAAIISKGSEKGLYQENPYSNYPSRIIKNWTSHFRREQLLIVIFDEIEKDPISVLSSIFDHIGVSVPDDWSDFPLFNRVNQNPKMEFPEVLRERLEAEFKDELSELEQVLGGLPDGWHRRPA